MIVLKSPLITEKTMAMAKEGMFTFIVDKRARKDIISKTVTEIFNVEVKSVKVANYKDQVKMQKRARAYFMISGVKRAVVELKKGQTIALFQPEEEKVVEVKTVDAKPEVKEKTNRLKGTKVKIEKLLKKEKEVVKGK